MASRVAGKIKLQSVDELLGVPEIAGTQEIEIGRIHAFPNHPFKVLDDEKMDTLVDSIRENGILNPVIVRPDNSGDYEMISGHRRLHAAGIAGLKKVPAIVKEMSDDEAIINMVDANIQREEILPSERAFSLKMKMDAMRRQGARVDVEGTCGNDCHKLGMKTADIVGDTVGLKGRQVRNYVRLTYLSPELLEMVDQKKIQFVIAVDLSYLDEQIQKWVYEYIKDKLRADLKKAVAKRDAADAKVKQLEAKLKEEENLQIVSDVASYNLSPEQLAQFLQLANSGRLQDMLSGQAPMPAAAASGKETDAEEDNEQETDNEEEDFLDEENE